MDQASVKLGLLIEAAQAHQKLAEAAVEKLSEQTRGLEAAVREQVQRALAEGLTGLRAETTGAVEALQAVKRAANARVALWTLGVMAAAAAIALFVAWWVLPTPANIATLRTERDALASNIAVLDQRGARADFSLTETVVLGNRWLPPTSLALLHAQFFGASVLNGTAGNPSALNTFPSGVSVQS